MNPKIITINTIRGGSGKTLFSILLSKYLPGKKLLVDTDIQNSLSFYTQVTNQNKNFFNAIVNQDIEGNIQRVDEHTDIIISEIKLLDIQNLEPNRFEFIKQAKGYDWIIIDTAPTYCGIIYNCFQISDLVILPCLLDFFSFKSLSYTLKKIESINLDTSIRVYINQYEKSKSNNSYLNQLLQTIEGNEDIAKYLSKVRIPRSIFFKQINDNMIDRIPDSSRTFELIKTVESFVRDVVCYASNKDTVFAEVF